ncbi:hypothetical protein TNCV_4942191 [Trichonephila clavipes]|nr:hypothetical protein TNCV_4942191 [Trichonephila clavipes]
MNVMGYTTPSNSPDYRGYKRVVYSETPLPNFSGIGLIRPLRRKVRRKDAIVLRTNFKINSSMLKGFSIEYFLCKSLKCGVMCFVIDKIAMPKADFDDL